MTIRQHIQTFVLDSFLRIRARLLANPTFQCFPLDPLGLPEIESTGDMEESGVD